MRFLATTTLLAALVASTVADTTTTTSDEWKWGRLASGSPGSTVTPPHTDIVTEIGTVTFITTATATATVNARGLENIWSKFTHGAAGAAKSAGQGVEAIGQDFVHEVERRDDASVEVEDEEN